MANQEQLTILRLGAKVWNKWRDENPGVKIELNEANLQRAYLRGVNLSEALLIEADLSRANLQEADLRNADLSVADIGEALLTRANLSGALLMRANLVRAILSLADLSEARLADANFSYAYLSNSNLSNADLYHTKFSHAKFMSTILGGLDLREVIGLKDVIHNGPSIIGTNTILSSRGKIPEDFLRGCGLSDFEIETTKLYIPEMSSEELSKILYKLYDLRESQAIQVSPLFISYSHGDGPFVDKLENHLDKKGIRFWRDIHDATSGRLEKQIDRAIRLNPTVLVILSERSLKSDWVEHEVREARRLEKEIKRDVLCPVALDDSWKDSHWPKRVMEQVMEYNILDFSTWEDDSQFGKIFDKFLDGLKLFYK